MSDANETIAAIVAEMRKAVVPMICGRPKIEAVSIRDVLQWADRIEAAAEREREETRDYFAKLHDGPSMICTAKNCPLRNAAEDIVEQVKADASFGHFAPVVVEDRPVGNVAAMREALIQCELFLANVCNHGHPKLNPGDECVACKDCEDMRSMVCKALDAAPARNCDRFATEDEAREAYWAYREPLEFNDKPFVAITEWLFAPAEGGAKCIDGLRGRPDCRGCDEHCLDVRKRNCFYWNPDIGKCALDGKPSCRIACDNFCGSKEEKPDTAEGGAQ